MPFQKLNPTEAPALRNLGGKHKTITYLYRTEEVDDEGDPYDWGAVTAKNVDEATAILTKHYDELGLEDIYRDTSLHVPENPNEVGILRTACNIKILP